tara:strand:- start:1960 stop:2121 length:162 start_codon:yes stop_codon:yes gene_type:complete
MMSEELLRLNKLYDSVYEKFETKIDKLKAKRDYELSSIYDAINKEKQIKNSSP